MKSGFVALIGRPNVGKSTLLNAILNKKVSIISPKPQTTRNSIMGVYNDDESQIVFVDTPGIHKPYFKLGEYMNKVAFASTRDVEAIVLLVDSSLEFGEGDQYLVDHIHSDAPIFVAFNKIDLTNILLITRLKEKYRELFPNSKFIEISALNNVSIDDLIKELKNCLSEGPQFFPREQVTDKDNAFVISEFIREKILYLTKQEIPHSVAVYVEKIEEKKDKYNIYATIVVERDTQKGILIGKGGKMIKRIGVLARKDIETYLNKRVNLTTFVRVEEEWRNSTRCLREFGYQDK
ncbi:MAG: GTPase Era [Erysipelotrichaceae bacterium]|nr:GTPase Era [Erysipelotrichaceae bacterium]